MKKIVSTILMFTIVWLSIVSLCGCNNDATIPTTNAVFNYSNDFQYYYNSLNGTNLPMTKSEGGYYVFLPNKYLYYIDGESVEATPLCNKVNCLHNDEECNAYFNLFTEPSAEMSNVIQFYENSLYAVVKIEDEFGSVEGNALYKVSLDGGTREKLIDFKDGISHWLIHRGYFYYSQDKFSDDIDSYSVYDSFTINRFSLNDLNKESEEIFNSKDYCSQIRSVKQFSAYDDYIYTSINPISDEEIQQIKETGKMTISSYKQEYYSIDTKTLNINKISNDEGDISPPSFYNGKLLYSIINADVESNVRYYTGELDGSNPVFLKEMECGDNLFSNGKQLYLQNLSGISDDSQKIDGYAKISILDSTFNETTSFTLPVAAYSIMNVPQDEEYFIYVNFVDNSNVEVCCIDKSKLENLKGSKAEYKIVYSSADNIGNKKNSIEKMDLDVQIDTSDSDLKNVFENTQKKLYKISSDYDDSLDGDISGGFSVNMNWLGDGGTYTANFQILKFNSESDASGFVKDNPFSFINNQYVAFVSIESVPVEIKDMLTSIIVNDPIDPIDSEDFSGEIYSFT